MALTIKNPETIGLARALARRSGTTQTGAITMALRQALDAIDTDGRAARVEAILSHVWNLGADVAETVRRNTAELYDERGLPA